MQSPTVRRIIGPTILLQSGAYFDLLDPEGSKFTIVDIAHGLSMTCRFAGQCNQFYSVAEHSVHASRFVPEVHARAALLHDGTEGFIGDMTKPLKDIIPGYREVEDRIEQAIFKRFGLTLPLSPEVKDVDLRMLVTEQRQLMHNRDDWNYSRGREPLDIVLPCWTPAEAKDQFLARFKELFA